MKKKWVWILIVMIVLGGGIWYKQHPTAEAPKYTKMAITSGDISVSISCTGVVAPQNRVEIKSPISGRVETILVQEGDHVVKGQVLAWISSTERSALLDIARIQGKDELTHWEELYKPTPLIAPITGDVISRKMEPGQTMGPSDAILVLSDHLLIQAQVDETDIGKLKLGQSAIVELDAFPGRPVPARVDHIAFEAQTVNNVTIYQVDVLPRKLASFLKSGMTTNVSFILNSKHEVILVPVQAIQEKRGLQKVIIGFQKNKKPVFTPIETGLSDGKNTEVLSGLNEGDSVYIPELKSLSRKKNGGTNPFMPGRPQGRKSQS